MSKSVCVLCAATIACVSARAADWPQWRGINRTGVTEEQVAGQWPDGGPKKVWDATLGEGYSTPAVVGDRLYVAGTAKVGDELHGFLYALDAATGKQIWSCDYGLEWSRNYPQSRSTPTVAGDKVFVVSALMDLVCVSTEGKLLGVVSFATRFNGNNLMWGFAESVLVYDDKIICHPGGPDASVVALSLKNGDTAWTSKGLSDAATYCSATLMTLHGVRQVVTHTANNLVGLDPGTGAILWKAPYRCNRGIQPNTPLLIDADTIIVGAGYGHGTHAFRVSKDGDAFSAEQIWENKDADNQHRGLILHEGVIFSAASRSGLHAIDPKTGKTLYRMDEVQGPGLVKTPGRLIGYTERGGQVFLLEANAEKYTIKGQFPVTFGEGQHWAYPVVANGVLYIRHGAVLTAYDVK